MAILRNALGSEETYRDGSAKELSLEYDVTVSRMIMTEEQWKKGELPVLRNIRAEGIPA